MPLLAGCIAAVDGTRVGDPPMRARFPTDAAATTSCLARAWESVRIDWPHGPLRVTTRLIGGRGTIVVELPPVSAVPWLVEVERAGDGAVALAWSRRISMPDLQPVFAGVMREAVASCRGELLEDRFERDARRRWAALVPRAGLEPARLAAADFKSATSTDSVIGAVRARRPYHACPAVGTRVDSRPRPAYDRPGCRRRRRAGLQETPCPA